MCTRRAAGFRFTACSARRGRENIGYREVRVLVITAGTQYRPRAAGAGTAARIRFPVGIQRRQT